MHMAKQALQLMDLTSLNDEDTDAVIENLCQQADTPFGSPAAVCVYPKFIQTARQSLDKLGLQAVKVATVTNFPHGKADIESARAQTQEAVAFGADEVDVVFPYQALIEGDEAVGEQLVRACKEACADKAKLKVIIESGELKSEALIAKASQLAINGGADFIKTSTGKVAVNATLSAAKTMLQVIKDSGRDVGFKAAGGVRTAEEAQDYLQLAKEMMGEDWVNAEHFRFGASGLLKNLLAVLNNEQQSNHQGY